MKTFREFIRIAEAYPSDTWNKDDETTLKFLKSGGAGSGPRIDKAIQDLLKQRGASGLIKPI